MQRGEIARVLAVLSEMYDITISELSTEIWFNTLRDFDIKDVERATIQYMRTGHYKPKPADIIDLIISDKLAQAEQPAELSAEKAWSMVYKAICNSTYNSVKEFEKLPDIVQQAVGSADNLRGFAIDNNFNLGVAQSNFIRAFNTLQKRRDNDRQLKINAVKRGELPLQALNTLLGIEGGTEHEQLIDKSGEVKGIA